ncbi:High affinity choline transporter 1 [Bagarius yarrelli]|nr:High affinity choline transporter 1 [Bagarius yarrelli]
MEKVHHSTGEVEHLIMQRFPFKTVSMLASFLSNVAFSYLFKYLFESGKLLAKYDFLDAVVAKHSAEIMDRTTLVNRNVIGLDEMAPVRPRLSVTLASTFGRKETLTEEEEDSSPESPIHENE